MDTFTIHSDGAGERWFVARENSSRWPVTVAGPFPTRESAQLEADRRADAVKRYRIAWVSVDGAGTYDEWFEDLADAITACDLRADYVNESESCGIRNPWGYSYRVVDRRYSTVHRSRFAHGRTDGGAPAGIGEPGHYCASCWAQLDAESGEGSC